MLKKTLGILSAVLMLGLSSCSDDNPWMGEAGKGAINLTLNTDGRVVDAVPLTRADESSVRFTSPEASRFSVSLVKTDGSYSRTFPLLEDFVKESETNGFPTGTYTLTAFHGRLEDIGFEEEGEVKAHFTGSATVNVLEGVSADVTVNARLGHALVSLEYTDEFRDYFKAYKAVLQTNGQKIDFAPEESRPAFVMPGEVGITVDITNQQGKEVTLHPADFIAGAACHYNVKLDVTNGDRSDFALKIVFDNETQKEEVTIDLTEELFTAPEPVVNPVGFQDGDRIEFLAGSSPEEADKYRFDVISHGGLKAVNMNFTPQYQGKLELIGLEPAMQNQLTQLGFNIKGIFRNPDQFAYVDFTDMMKNLQEGTYTLSLEAIDLLTRTSNVVSVTLVAVAPTVEVVPEKAVFGTNQGTLVITYNGSHPAQDFRFRAMDDNGFFEDCTIVGEPENITRTRSIQENTYRFTISLPDSRRDKIPVEVYLYDKLVKTVDLPVETPEYDVQFDAFANKVLIKVTADNAGIQQVITKLLNIFDSENKKIDESYISRNASEGMITVSGLRPQASYNFKSTLTSTVGANAKAMDFTTEPDTDVPNGNFSQTSQSISYSSINVGAPFRITFGVSGTYQIRSSIERALPDSWATLNTLTCYDGSQPQNTWFMVPSTWVESGQAVIQSVGYHHNGVLPATTNSMTTYYNPNAPENLDVSPGEMFLGEYTFDGTQKRVDGIDWSSRPAYFSFDYKYEPQGAESGEAYLELIGQDGSTLQTKRIVLDQSAGMTNKVVKLENYPFGKKAKTIKIGFLSTKSGSTPNIYKPSGSDLKESEINAGNFVLNAVVSTNNYAAYARGSKLTVANVKLGYDDNASSPNAAKRKTSKKRR